MPVEPVSSREVPDPLSGALSGQDAQPFEQMQRSDGHEQQSGLVVKEPQPAVEECGDTRECRSKEADREQEVILLRPPIPPASAVLPISGGGRCGGSMQP